ncbi:MAG: ribosome silencing factor [Spirochaetales bacterium]|nr:ribosome silencing factor [Spirochaetales bacterium]
MEDTANKKTVMEIATLLEEHNGRDIVVLDIREQSSWTDYFIIATIGSKAHMRGLLRYVHQYLSDHSIKPMHPHKRANDDGWILLDCGGFVIHLMSNETRGFYELERLWYSGTELYHSSKSS